MVTCPFTKTHTMPRQRLPWHLARCSFKGKKPLLHCPFNLLHLINAVQFEDHVSNCPDKPVSSRQEYDVTEFIDTIRATIGGLGVKPTENHPTEVEIEKKPQELPAKAVIPEETTADPPRIEESKEENKESVVVEEKKL